MPLIRHRTVEITFSFETASACKNGELADKITDGLEPASRNWVKEPDSGITAYQIVSVSIRNSR